MATHDAPTEDRPSGAYADAHARSLRDPEGFWLDAARAIDWTVAPTRALDDSAAPLYRWFPDGELNTAFNCLDRHVEAGRGDAVALIHDSAMTGEVTRYTYAELTDAVARLAGALAARGVGKGDRVLVYLPMIPQAHIAMLACARLGAVHSVVFGGFAPRELASRIDDAAPDVVLTCSGGIEPKRRVEYLPAVAEALETAAHPVRTVLVHHREGFETALADADGRGGASWEDWGEAVAAAEPADCVPVQATDPLYVLYTSGTTGKPKGVVRDNGGHAVALRWTMEHIYDVGPGQAMCTASDVGWVVGHSYIVYGPLLAGATTVMYEGKPVGTPDAGAFWRLIEDHGVRSFFTAPTALRAIRRADPEGELLQAHDLSSLRHFFAAGERLDPETQRWIEGLLGMPVRLVETHATSAPLAMGVLDPVIALPPGFLALHDRRARDLALAHELAHHRGGDLLVNILVQPLFALHWWNPLGRYGWLALRRDQEAACDARVMAARAPADRAASAQASRSRSPSPSSSPRRSTSPSPRPRARRNRGSSTPRPDDGCPHQVHDAVFSCMKRSTCSPGCRAFSRFFWR